MEGGGQFKGERIIVTEVASLMEGSGQFKGERIIVTDVASLKEGEWSLHRWSV